MALVLGLDCKMYYGVAGAPAANIMNNVQDVTLTLETDEADVTTRGAQGWECSVATLKKGGVSFKMLWDTADAAFLAIQAAWLAKTPLAFKILDGVGGHGLDADFAIMKFTRNEPLKEAVTCDVEIKPTYSTRAPAWV